MEPIQHTIQIIRQHLIQLLIILFFVITVIFDFLTFPIYFVWQQPWNRWHLIYQNRSIPDSNYPGQLVRKSIKKMPDHFLNHCQTIDGAFEKAYQIYGSQRKCLGYRKILSRQTQMEPPFVKYKLGDYQWITWKMMMDSIEKFATGLRQLMNVGKGDRVMIFAETCYQWFIAAQGIIKNGSVLTTLYSTLGNQGIFEAIKETEIQILITTRPLFSKLISHPQRDEIFIQLKFIILLDLEENNFEDRKYFELLHTQMNNNNENDIQLYSYEQVLNAGDVDFFHRNPNKNYPDDLAIIMYTSGSGGRPKGVLMTHRNLMQGFQGHISLIECFLPEISRHVYIGYLPLAHILEFGTETIVVLIGLKLGYSSPHTLIDMSPGLMPGIKGDASLLRPTVMAAVPLVLERIYKAILERLNQQGLLTVKFFEFLIEYKTFWMSKGFKTPILDRLFLRKFRNIIGGQLEALLVGGAPLASETQKWIRACLNIIFVQGYGATETVAGGLFMDEYDYTLAKVGGPLYGTKIKLVDWSEGGYTTDDKPNPRGEIHLSSQSTSIGYFKCKHLDNEVYYEENGEKWFRTGDVGEMFPNGTFKIIDRKKDFIKLQFGEYVSLGMIETKLKSSYLVNQICVVGNSLQKYLIAIVVPNIKAIERISPRLLSDVNQCHPYENTKIQKIFNKKMIRHAKRNGLRRYEIPRHFILAKNEWTPENGLVTASFKLKRKQIEQYYSVQIEKLFINKFE